MRKVDKLTLVALDVVSETRGDIGRMVAMKLSPSRDSHKRLTMENDETERLF